MRLLALANTPIVALLSLLAFLALARYAQHEQYGHDRAEIEALNRLVERANEEKHPVVLTREQYLLASLYLDDGQPVKPAIMARAQRAVRKVRGH